MIWPENIRVFCVFVCSLGAEFPKYPPTEKPIRPATYVWSCVVRLDFIHLSASKLYCLDLLGPCPRFQLAYYRGGAPLETLLAQFFASVLAAVLWRIAPWQLMSSKFPAVTQTKMVFFWFILEENMHPLILSIGFWEPSLVAGTWDWLHRWGCLICWRFYAACPWFLMILPVVKIDFFYWSDRK